MKKKNPKPVKNPKPGKVRRPKKAAVEDAEESQEVVAPPKLARMPKLEKTVETLKIVAAYISTAEDVEEWLQSDEEIKELEQQCSTISNLLRTKIASRNINGAWDPRPIEELEQFYIFRDGAKSLKVLSTVEEFDCVSTGRYTSRRAFAMIRKAKSFFPEMCALGGRLEGLQPHPKLLDSTYWTDEVQKFGDSIEFKFRSNGFDAHHGNQMGSSFASHAEKQLILWWSFRVFQKKFPKETPSIKKIYKLGRLNLKHECEILIDREPCGCCDSFRTEIEYQTGIKFEFVLVRGLGKITPYRNESGQLMFPTTVTIDDTPDQDNTFQASIDISRSNFRVEIPRRLATEFVQAATSTMSSESDVVVRAEKFPKAQGDVPQQKTRGRPRLSGVFRVENQPPKGNNTMIVKPQQHRTSRRIHEDLWDADWTPQGSSTRSPKTPQRPEFPTGLRTPDSELFSDEARKQAKEMKDKRKRKEREAQLVTSPTAAKKIRSFMHSG